MARPTRKDLDTIRSIAERAVRLYQDMGLLNDRDARFVHTATVCEILMVHQEIVPLRLEELLAADDANFAHDVGGIHRHLDMATRTYPAVFKDCFMPRFANNGLSR